MQVQSSAVVQIQSSAEQCSAVQCSIRPQSRAVVSLEMMMMMMMMMMPLFPSSLYHCRFIFVWRVRCTFSFRLVFFYVVTTDWILTSAYLRIQPINQVQSSEVSVHTRVICMVITYRRVLLQYKYRVVQCRPLISPNPQMFQYYIPPTLVTFCFLDGYV